MDILDIAIAKQLAGGGGGSGTDNYNDLSNLPKINDVTLSGNKSSSALGLQSEITSENKLDSDLIDDTNQDNKFVTSTEKNTWNAKQNAIDADHKINADYVDDSTSTNKFVTATDKETWNAKQNAIDNSHKLSSDLVDDTNHTNKFVTSTEKNTWNGKQNAIDSEHKLSSSLVSFTTAEAAALASGIDSAKVAQISTNQSNIWYACKRVGKNLFDITSPDSTRNTTVTPLDNGGATLSCSSAMWTQYYKTIPTEIGKEYKVVLYIDNIAGVGSNEFIVSFKRTNPEGSNYAEYENITTTGTHEATFTATVNTLCVAIFLNNSATSKTSSANVRIMICEKNIYDIVGSDYERFALPNYDLTRLEAEDRASLAEEIDAGAKNVLNCSVEALKAISRNTEGTWSGNVYTVANVGSVTVNSDGSLKVVKTGTSAQLMFRVTDLEFSGTKYAGYILSGSPKNGSDSTYRLIAEQSQSPWGNIAIDEGDGGVMKSSSIPIYVYLRLSASYTTSASGITFYPMLCTKAAFGVSPKFVAYRYDPYTTALQNISNSTTLYARRCGRVVTVNGYMDNISFTANTAVTIGTIDSSIGIPPNQVRAVCNVGSNAYSVGKQGYVTISSTDGQIKVTSEYSGTGAVYFSLSYII